MGTECIFFCIVCEIQLSPMASGLSLSVAITMQLCCVIRLSCIFSHGSVDRYLSSGQFGAVSHTPVMGVLWIFCLASPRISLDVMPVAVYMLSYMKI